MSSEYLSAEMFVAKHVFTKASKQLAQSMTVFARRTNKALASLVKLRQLMDINPPLPRKFMKKQRNNRIPKKWAKNYTTYITVGKHD